MEHSAFALEVRVNGRTVREYQHQGEIWIEGRKGSDFTLRIRNRSRLRVLAVPTVDGLSVMNGEEASYESSGYVIDACGFVDIPGWRLNDDQVASFLFHKSGKSYAAQKGTPRNIGVIGCGFFVEKVLAYAIHTRSLNHEFVDSGGGGGGVTVATNFVCSNSNVAPHGAGGAGRWGTVSSAAPSLGTDFGAEMAHKVMTTTFMKAHDKPEVEMAIRYGDREELKHRGVDLEQKPIVAHRPSAFPKEEAYCKPPPGWSGR